MLSNHYKDVPTDCLGTGCRPFGIRGTHFGNHCSKALTFKKICILPMAYVWVSYIRFLQQTQCTRMQWKQCVLWEVCTEHLNI
jgi:hypothetical protein